MKKFFTLMAALMAVVCVNAATEENITSKFSYTWQSTESLTANADGSITYNSVAWGGLAAWINGEGENWSSWDKIVFEFAEATTVNTQIFVQRVDDSNDTQWGNVGITRLEMSFEGKDVSTVKQVALQTSEPTSITITKISLVQEDKVVYAHYVKPIKFDEWGNILSSEFDGLTDDAKIVFTVTAEGEATNADGSVLGWGIGTIKSLDGSVTVGDLPLKQIGDNEYSFLLKDMRAALAAPANEYNMQGINWNVWN